MIKFVSEIGDGQVNHTAYMDGRSIWEGANPTALLETEDFSLWPQGEMVQLCAYFEKYSSLPLTATWSLSETTGVSEIALLDGGQQEFYGTIFSLFESSPL